MAECKCPSICSGQLPWSLELDKVGHMHLHWSLHVWEFTAEQTDRVALDKLAQLCQIPMAEQVGLPSHLVHKFCHQACKAFAKAKSQATQL